MSEVVLGGDGRAVIHNQRTGQEMFCSVPTALENVANSGGIWAHGHLPAGMEGAAAPAPVAAPEPVIALVDPDHMPLPSGDEPAPDPEPAAEPEPEPEPEAPVAGFVEAAAPVLSVQDPDPLDHDSNGKKGGSRKPADPERAAIIKALKAANIKFFAGAPTAKLKALLPA